MGDFFDTKLRAEESLFRNEEALDFVFMPKDIQYRENQKIEIASCVQPLFADRNGKNLVIFGPPGIGKTLVCRSLMEEIEEKSDDIATILINCWKKSTSYKIVMEICHLIGYRFTQNKKTDELIREVVKLLNKKKVMFVFDEIDRAEDYDFLYTLSEEIYKKSIILITNEKNFLTNMDDRIKSRMMPGQLEFKPYNIDETRGILKQREEYAFVKDVWKTDAFEIIVQKTAALQDIRAGMHLLKDSGDVAEGKSSRIIDVEHVKKAIDRVDELSALKSTDLKDEDKIVLSIVKKNSKSKIGDLFKFYQDAGGKSVYKTFQRKINQFEKDGFVKLTKSSGSGGNTTIVEYKERTKKLDEFSNTGQE